MIHLIPRPAQPVRHQSPVAGVVVDNKDAFRHQFLPSLLSDQLLRM